jgi:hypothetical protein
MSRLSMSYNFRASLPLAGEIGEKKRCAPLGSTGATQELQNVFRVKAHLREGRILQGCYCVQLPGHTYPCKETCINHSTGRHTNPPSYVTVHCYLHMFVKYQLQQHPLALAQILLDTPVTLSLWTTWCNHGTLPNTRGKLNGRNASTIRSKSSPRGNAIANARCSVASIYQKPVLVTIPQ